MSPDFGPQEFADASGVSRETLARLQAFVALLLGWNGRYNLISRASCVDVWRRHVWDSAQLNSHIPPTAKSLADLGSGAGFPGLILAAMRKEQPGFRTTLYEATRKKCDFLQEAAAHMGLSVEVRCGRIEEVSPEIFEVVTSRACAPLPKLLGYASQFQGSNTVNLFLKGQNVASEIVDASKYWKFTVAQHPSLSDPSGTILNLRELCRVR